MKLPVPGSYTRFPIFLLILTTLTAAHAFASSSPLQGTWRLAEQGRGSGRAGIATLEAPARIECLATGPEMACRLWSAENPPRAFDWPAFVGDEGPLPLRILRREIDPRAGRLRADYEVDLPGSAGRTLKLVEDYRVRGDGDLAGTVRVTLHEDGENQGSWTLRRRYVRER